MPVTQQTPEMEAAIICSISEGKSLTSWCKEHKINIATIYNWFDKNPAFNEAYARARLMQVDFLAEEILDISDDLTIPDSHKRIMVDSRKWYAGKLNQQKYGDKQHLEITGKDGEPLSIRLIEAQQRLLKDITPKTELIEHLQPITPDDVI
jgi:hypothetical protein